ncbi:MAG: SMI1/KNR4 family protein [Eubacteriaceae bacterium]|nr:SMI1/KNR4 family protein [Eubacteriaceae bacterium]
MAIKGFGKADIDDIKSFELKNDLNLPDDYIDFLLKYNGGEVELTDNNSFFIKGINDNVNIDVLYGVNTENLELSVELWLNDYKIDMPPYTLIVGSCYQYGFIVMLCYGEDAGIYYWDDSYEYACSNDDNNVFFMVDTFSDIVDKILRV